MHARITVPRRRENGRGEERRGGGGREGRGGRGEEEQLMNIRVTCHAAV